MIAIDARKICLDDLSQLHVRRWLELAFDGPEEICKLDNLVAITQDHPGYDADATLAEQWALWEECLELAGAFSVAKPR